MSKEENGTWRRLSIPHPAPLMRQIKLPIQRWCSNVGLSNSEKPRQSNPKTLRLFCHEHIKTALSSSDLCMLVQGSCLRGALPRNSLARDLPKALPKCSTGSSMVMTLRTKRRTTLCLYLCTQHPKMFSKNLHLTRLTRRLVLYQFTRPTAPSVTSRSRIPSIS